MAKANALALAVSAAQKGRQAPAVQTTPQARAGRAKNPAFTTLSVYVPRELHTRVKLAAIEEGREMSAVVESLLETWLVSRPIKQPR